jgi:Leucine-rich repeat (LRR) protein
VTGVQIAYSHFDRIPSSIFTNFGEVKRLKILKSKIDKIDREDFAYADDLQSLEIIDSAIGSISSGAFVLLRNLEEVVLNGNRISNYETPYDNRLEKLKTIKVDGQDFGFQNEEVGKRRV